MRLQRRPSRVLGDMTPYAGSQWWALTHAACTYVLRFCDERQEVVRYFHNVTIPDESFFQTVLGNSPFRERMTRNFTYSDWSRPQPPHPAFMDEAHIRGFIENSGCYVDDGYGKGECLFARKFGEGSEDLTRLVREHLW